MNCSGCEARREWIRQHTERAKLKMQRLLQQLSSRTDQRVSGTDSNSQHAKRSHGSNHESK
ncbi:hypothetical protein [Acinetobacter junii]|uniref:hypothetical protein n=1 Tax=Acinetobacter junii TaxID=40215 RepID=UPI00100E33EB|nr:hypothetical protein [Acinetobacter junii]RXS93961.1 hypothetical protein ETZ13_10795 [Acinetobacter junii]UOB51273.1 hypothetical protein MRY16_08985 [Acinetobacter junii]